MEILYINIIFTRVILLPKVTICEGILIDNLTLTI